MTIGQAPECLECKHLDLASAKRGPDAPRVPRCKAFPRGIPDEIYFEGRSHREPYPGDKGIRFEPKDPSETSPR